MNFDIYNGKRVLVTGHTGFKGAWLCEWLLALGAEVHGFALEPPTTPALFTQLALSSRLAADERGDVRDRAAVARCVERVRPDFIFHLAAQPIVRESYRTPAETFDVNVMGTVNVLEAVRRTECGASVVCITTDKVYENNNSGRAFVEGDPLGGCDLPGVSRWSRSEIIEVSDFGRFETKERMYTMAEVVELKQEDFAAAIAAGVTLVDFWAPWCGPCRMQGTVLEKIAPALGDKAKVCKVNVDECPEVAAQFGVQSIPALIVFKDGTAFKEFNGLTRAADLTAAIDAACA